MEFSITSSAHIYSFQLWMCLFLVDFSDTALLQDLKDTPTQSTKVNTRFENEDDDIIDDDGDTEVGKQL